MENTKLNKKYFEYLITKGIVEKLSSEEIKNILEKQFIDEKIDLNDLNKYVEDSHLLQRRNNCFKNI